MTKRPLAGFVLVVFLLANAHSQDSTRSAGAAPESGGAVDSPRSQTVVASDEPSPLQADVDPGSIAVFLLRHAQAKNVARTIEQLLIKRPITLAVDEKTNSIILHSNQESRSLVEELISALDSTSKTAVQADVPTKGGLKGSGNPVLSADASATPYENSYANIAVAELRRKFAAQERNCQLLGARHKAVGSVVSCAACSRH
jgi:hypothetical protein